MRILLVNPPIYDFTAYDFWLRPYGLMRVAGHMQHACRIHYFNFLISRKRDKWGRGRFPATEATKPGVVSDVPRRFHRFGRARSEFRDFLGAHTFDAILIQTSMTYWYPGVREVIEDVRTLQPGAKIILGGIYATLCPLHAQSLGADLVIRGADLSPLWQLLALEPTKGVPYWPYDEAGVGTLKISEGCPFHCSYCSAPLLWPGFSARPTAECLDELQNLVAAGCRNIAFYDDALLFKPEQALMPFLKSVIQSGAPVTFHTPNALNARFVTSELARLMVQAGFAGFYMGLESTAASWQSSSGGKMHAEEFAAAVEHLRSAGAQYITGYVILGHPDLDSKTVENSIYFAHGYGVRVLLSEFSPIPGTVDGEKSRLWADLDEPLSHNKTAFALRRLGAKHINRLKTLTHTLNAQIPADLQ